VDWDPAATGQLTDIWMKAHDRPAVTSASNEIDRLLQSDPVGNGQLVSEGLYRVIVPPLVAYYEVDVPGRTVNVTGVGRIV
jgi:hypothetical protein